MDCHMDSSRDLWLLLPKQVRRLPADLAAVDGLVVLTCFAVLTPGVRETPLRVVLGLPFVLFLPGYAFIAALFPEAGESVDAGEDASVTRDAGIDGLERVALSFGLSIAVVPLIGLVLNFTPWGIRLGPVLLAVSTFTVAAASVAAVRRWELPADEQFVVPYEEWLAAARAELFRPETQTDAALNVVVVLSVLLAVGSVGFAVAVPQDGEAFTEFYLLMEDDDGELVADGYPTEFEQGESASLHVGIGNHEHQQESYMVVVLFERVETANNSTTVLEQRELNRFSTTVDDEGTWLTEHTVTPRMTGENLRLTYLLYRGEPGALTTDDAYRQLHLWVTVTPN